jgi:TRAP-type uncharacterized transport system substrate-binding protein
MSFRLPRWLRMVLFVLVLCLTIGIGLKGLQEAVKPVTLTLAVGSLDGEAVRVMTAISSRMAATGAPVRVNVVDKGNPIGAAEAFAAGEAQLAVVRGDNEELGSARTVVQLTNLILMLMVPPNSPIKTVADLKGKTVGVVGLVPNQRLLGTLVKTYGFTQGSVQFADVPLQQLMDPNRGKKYQAALFAVPLNERYTSVVRSFFPPAAKAQPHMLEIDAAEAIGMETKYYESFDLPKGAVRGAPPLPDDTLSTLRVPVYLVAGAKVADETIAALAKAIMEARRELATDMPLLTQIAGPDDDKNAPIPIHPGAKAFFEGSEKTWSDKYGDWLFYGPIVLGMVGSFLAGLWKFLTSDSGNRTDEMLRRIASLIDRSRKAGNASELDAIERESDRLLDEYLMAQVRGQVDADQATRLNLMFNHMESTIARRGNALNPARGLARG